MEYIRRQWNLNEQQIQEAILEKIAREYPQQDSLKLKLNIWCGSDDNIYAHAEEIH